MALEKTRDPWPTCFDTVRTTPAGKSSRHHGRPRRARAKTPLPKTAKSRFTLRARERADLMSELTASGFRISTAPCIAGGLNVTQQAIALRPSIFRDPNAKGKARVIMPKENASYPDSRHTLPKRHHNINHIPLSERPGKGHYDPVLLGGKSVIDHYPYAAATSKECYGDPVGELAAMRAGH